MPYGNGTGPDGMGPGTGRGMGYCAGYDRPGCYNPGFGGRGRAAGRGIGRGAGFGFAGGGRGLGRAAGGRFFGFAGGRQGFNADNSISEMDFLKGQQEDLELELAAVKERLKTIGEKTEEKK